MIDYGTPGLSEPHLLLAGGKLNVQLPWVALSVRIDNPPGGQWLHLVNTPEFIPPGTMGAVRNLAELDQALAEWAAPPGVLQPPAALGQQAVLTYYSVWLPPDPGVSVTSIATGGASGATATIMPLAVAPNVTVNPAVPNGFLNSQVSYQVVPVNAAGADGPPSPAVQVLQPARTNLANWPTVLGWPAVVGAVQYRVLRLGPLALNYANYLEALAGADPLPLGVTAFTDVGAGPGAGPSVGRTYTPATAQVLAPLSVSVSAITTALGAVGQGAPQTDPSQAWPQVLYQAGAPYRPVDPDITALRRAAELAALVGDPNRRSWSRDTVGQR